MKLPRMLVIIAGISMLVYLLSPAISNIWFLAIDSQDVYVIPKGSSLFTFRPTEMNSGSGDWWIYGEDNRHYYYFEHGRKISRQAAQSCRNFVKTDLSTWCKNK